MLRQVVIVGAGLIGTSFALALKRRYPSLSIRAIDSREECITQAVSRGAIDSACSYAQAGAADVVLFAIRFARLVRRSQPLHRTSPRILW